MSLEAEASASPNAALMQKALETQRADHISAGRVSAETRIDRGIAVLLDHT